MKDPDELKRLLAAATPVPWHYHEGDIVDANHEDVYCAEEALSGNWANNAVGGDGYEHLRGWMDLKTVIPRSANYLKRLHDLLLGLERSLAEPSLPFPLDAFAETSSPALRGLAALPTLPSAPKDKISDIRVMEILTLVEERTGELELTRTPDRIRHFKELLQSSGSKPDTASIRHELQTLKQALDDDLDQRKVYFPNEDKFALVVKMGKTSNFALIHQNLPDAHYELLQAQSCYLTDNDPACVYHALNAAEYGLRALATRRRVAKRQRNSWGTMISGLRRKMEGPPGKPQLGLQQKKRSARRNKLLDYYSQLLDQCVFFNEHWRKRVAHIPPRYTAAEALNALMRAAEFVKLLAERGLKLPRQFAD